jgi:hypothetical protein
MIITKIKIILPIWNCGKCLVDRKKWLEKYVYENIGNIDDDLILEIILCKDNSNDMNVRMICEFKDLLTIKLPNKKIRVLICG